MSQSRQIWFTCCSHFHHEKLLSFTKSDGSPLRPEFSNAKEMNEALITAWNECVGVNDHVYHLGDVYSGNNEAFEDFKTNIFGKLKGAKKELILGNHDCGKKMAQVPWSSISTVRHLHSEGLVASHYPLHESNLYSHYAEQTLVNVHGHIHDRESPEGPYVNVCVERNSYKPFHLDEVLELAKGTNG